MAINYLDGSNPVEPNDVLPVSASISSPSPEVFAAGAGVTVPNQVFSLGVHAGSVIPTLPV